MKSYVIPINIYVTDKDKSLCKRDGILHENAEDTVAGAHKQWKNLKENGDKYLSHIQNQKGTSKASWEHNENVLIALVFMGYQTFACYLKP